MAFPNDVHLTNGVPDTGTGNVNTINALMTQLLSGPTPVRPGDGTNTITVKAGNVAAQATDTAVVVQQSPLGEVADGVADSGNGSKISAKAHAALSADTMLTNAQRGDLACDLDRTLIIRPNAPLGDLTNGRVVLTTTTSTVVLAAGAAGVKNYVTSVAITNTSATPGFVDIRDGIAGTVKWTLPVPANFSGVIDNFGGTPLGGFTAATGVFAQASVAATSIIVCMNGFKSKI